MPLKEGEVFPRLAGGDHSPCVDSLRSSLPSRDFLDFDTAWSCNLRASPSVNELLQEIWFSCICGVSRPVVSLEGVHKPV